MADWTDFLKAPTKAAKQLHVSKGDIAKGERLNAYDRLAERMKSGEPYGQTPKDPVEEIENPYPRIRAQLRDKMISDARRKYGEAAPKVTGSLSSSLDVLRHAFMRDEEAKDIARGLAMTAGLVGGVAAPMMVPSAPALTGAVINAATGIPINLALNSPEGIPQDAVAGGVMGALAAAGHPGLGALAGLASYAATNVPEASAMPLHSWMKRLNALNKVEPTAMYVNPTNAELLGMMRDARETYPTSPTVRLLRDQRSNDVYGVEGSSILHDDMRKHLKLKYEFSPGSQGSTLPELDTELHFLKSLPRLAGGGAVKRLGKAAMSQFDELRGSSVAPLGALSVVKNKGGNWLAGSVEDALKGLKKNSFPIDYPLPNEVAQLRRVPGEGGRELFQDPIHGNVFTPEQVAGTLAIESRDGALNQWIDNQLTKYVKNRMATPEDEVRRLAEQGVLHIPLYNAVPTPAHFGVAHSRVSAGFPADGLATTPVGRQWEDLSDRAIATTTAGDARHPNYYLDPNYRDKVIGGNPWLQNAAPEAAVHYPNSTGHINQLGFDHLIDELSNALNPESGLPRNLQLSPEAVANLSMEKAVRRVADINAWRAAQKIEANRKLAEQAALVREYAENNPKGLRWVELKAGDAPEGWIQQEVAGTKRWVDPQGRIVDFNDDPVRAELERQLKYEGDTMGHCVGGYCDDVLSGRSRIFSLRDAKGEPHVTVEVKPPSVRIPHENLTEARNMTPEEFQAASDRMGSVWATRQDALSKGWLYHPEVPYWIDEKSLSPSVLQIKGKQNRAPNPEYLPFVQDFVRNSPLGRPWGDVGDIKNAGLYRSNTLSPDEMKAFPDKEYLTMEEIKKLREGKPWTPIDTDPEFAHGGSVRKPSAQNNDFQAIIAALEQELAHAAG